MEARKSQYADMVNKYYDLATSFYEYGASHARPDAWLQQFQHQYTVPASLATRASLALVCEQQCMTSQ